MNWQLVECSVSIATNGSGIADVVALELPKLKQQPKLIRCTQLIFCTSATI